MLLGDTTLANMTAIPTSVFQIADVRLRVWFNDGTNGSQLLSPDQRIAAVGYAMMAGAVPNGAITRRRSPTEPWEPRRWPLERWAGPARERRGHFGNLATGAVSAAQLNAGAAAANLSASGLSGVPSGGVVLAPASGVANLQSLGYANLGQLLLGDVWEPRTIRTRIRHTAVWTGSEMIVWGGSTAAARFERRRALQSGGEQLDGGDHHRRARRAHRSHGGVDGQRDDRLGRTGRRQLSV